MQSCCRVVAEFFAELLQSVVSVTGALQGRMKSVAASGSVAGTSGRALQRLEEYCRSVIKCVRASKSVAGASQQHCRARQWTKLAKAAKVPNARQEP